MRIRCFTALTITGLLGWFAVGVEPSKNAREQPDGPIKIRTPTTAVVKGIIKFKGNRPEIKKLADRPAFKEHADKAYCAMGDVTEQQWMIDKEGHVENVVVSLEPLGGQSFKITDQLKGDYKKRCGELVTIDTSFCQFVPHVAAMYVDVQEFQIRSSTPVRHSPRFVGQRSSPASPFFESGKSRKYKFIRQNDPIKIECGDHTWMFAFLVTFDHPYFAVTKKDGSFEIAHVPIDEELTVYVWHEVPGKREAKMMRFKEGENKLELTVSN